MADSEALKSALEKVKEQKRNFGFMERFNVDENLEVMIAIEKQIPQKPVFGGLYACPNCKKIMLQGALETRGNYCKECGQALDWEV